MLHPVWKRTSGLVPCHGERTARNPLAPFVLLNASHAALPPKHPGASLGWKTSWQFPGGSLKSINDQELLSNRHRCQSHCAGACSRQEARSNPPFLSLRRLPLGHAVIAACRVFWKLFLPSALRSRLPPEPLAVMP